MPPSIRFIEPAELHALMQGDDAASVAVVDARDDDRTNWIVGSISYPSLGRSEESWADIARRLEGVPTIVFHCMFSQIRGPSTAREFALRFPDVRRALAPEAKATFEAECAVFNAAVRAEWDAYKATEEYRLAIAAFTAAGGHQQQARKRGRSKSPQHTTAGEAVGADEETDDEAGAVNVSERRGDAGGGSSREGQAAAAGANSQWRRNRRGEWVCEWDESLSDGSATDAESAVGTPQRVGNEAAANSDAPPRRAQPPVLGSLFGVGESSGGLLGQMTRNSTVAALGQATVDGSDHHHNHSSMIARRRTSRYLSAHPSATRDEL